MPHIRKAKSIFHTFKNTVKKNLSKNVQTGTTIVYQKFDELTVYFEVLRRKDFKYIIIFSPEEKIIKYSNTEVEILEGDRPSFVNFHIPRTGKASRDRKDKIIITSKILSYFVDSTFLCIQSPMRINSIEPILANSNPFPDNYVCGFSIKGENTKFVLFLHTAAKQSYKGSEHINSSFFTVFKFQSEELTDVWNIDNNKRTEHF